MRLSITPKENQAFGQFNGGQILENKPIGFPQDGGNQRPYSNLFYWAHAWSDKGSLLGEHPHQGFEIMSFVLKGEIEHYDSHHKKWKALKEGDAQIIRSGRGITHAENFKKGSHIFQIWMDPDLSKTTQQDASYDDYEDQIFPLLEVGTGHRIKTYKGEGSPFAMDSPGVLIYEHQFETGAYPLELNEDIIYSTYLVEGKLELNGDLMEKDGFAILEDGQNALLRPKRLREGAAGVKALETSRLFVIETPRKIDYPTYQELMQSRFSS